MSLIPHDLMEPVMPREILLEEPILPGGLSQTALANAIGVPPRRIKEIVLGERAIAADTDLPLARYWGMSEGGLPEPAEELRNAGPAREDGRGAGYDHAEAA